jgi:hypothetical protein
MVPQSLATLYALLALVTPGLTCQLVSERTRPSREESTFREASVVAVTSLVFSTLSVLILAAISKVRPSWFVDLVEWLDLGDGYASDHLWLVARSVGTEVLLAVLLAASSAWLLSLLPASSKSSIAKASVWYQSLKGDKPKDKASWVMAELADGTRIWGYVHFFTIQDLGNDRDISFMGPGLNVQRPGEAAPAEETYYKYVVVSAEQIRLLKVAHESRAKDRRQGSFPQPPGKGQREGPAGPDAETGAATA